MPDHIHFFASPTDMKFSLESWMAYWKSMLAKTHKRKDWRWQRSHWDTRIRSGKDYDEKWQYIREIPVRKGLIEAAEKWPYQGMMHDLVW